MEVRYSKPRLFPRFRFTPADPSYAKVIDQNTQREMLVATRDLSPTGIAFADRKDIQFNSGDKVLLEISPFGTKPMRCWAKIVRAETLDGGTLYGAQFLALPLWHQERLHKLIREALFDRQIDDYVSTQARPMVLPTKVLLKRLAWLTIIAAAVGAQLAFLQNFWK